METGILCPFPQTLRKIGVDNKYCIRLGMKYAVKKHILFTSKRQND